MIFGIGTDICDMERIARALERQGDRFRNRICSDREQAFAGGLIDEIRFFAGRFAAKEACAKALGTGITERVRWRHIEVLPGPNGAPVLHLSEGARRRATRLAGRTGFKAHVCIEHNGFFAIAFVVLETSHLSSENERRQSRVCL